MNISKKPLDTIPNSINDAIKPIREYFFSAQWHEVCDFIEWFATTSEDVLGDLAREEYIKQCNAIFEREKFGYRFIGNLITPITNEQEIRTIEDVLQAAANNKLTGIHEHLNTALKMLSDRKAHDYRNSIKESISAVESLACTITNKPKATLGDALEVVGEKIKLHGALKAAFGALYGYTSDEDGIRHKILEEKEIYFEDALFLFVSCSAFINYLIQKCQRVNIKLK
ncbi:MAG: hypothetical protein HY663_00835 [Chloroflexi bacterium]|nr:hypothetical protein [Chloroflexota bacterium]